MVQETAKPESTDQDHNATAAETTAQQAAASTTTSAVEQQDHRNSMGNHTGHSADQHPSMDHQNTTAQDTHSPSPNNNPQKHNAESNAAKKKVIVVIVLLLFLALIGFGLWKSYQPKSIELQGRVESETVYVSTKVPSRIEEIFVTEGQKIKRNQPLVRLHSPEIEARKQQAQASLATALALQSKTDRGSEAENIDSLYANWQGLKAQEKLAQTTYTRGIALYKEGVIARQRLDQMQASAISSREMTEAAYQQYLRAKRGSTSEQKTTADAQVEIAKAALHEVNALEAEVLLLSPVNGTVSKTYGKVSELVAIGVPVVSVLEDEELWVSLNVREDQYVNIYQAQTLQGFIPALNRHANFKISNIDAEGEFATIKTTRQTGGYDIRSFKFHLIPKQPIPGLKAGMSVIFNIKGNQ
ncbi:RND transporter [Acinetobacter larvae]|uniref:RND transporter n=2 Tax=Acinetobacter larvae TaxID=1789224 RepID=A0A1B2M1H9_9GAMM|nr:RND transporter [Acinetobacter larvae]